MRFLRSLLKIYEDIYNNLSDALTTNEDNSLKIENQCNRFRKEESKFFELVDPPVKQSVYFEHDEWKDNIKVSVSEYCHFTLKITFYIDKPVINEYVVVVDEKEHSEHYRFKQSSHESANRKIQLASNLNITFNDDVVDEMRIGKIASSCFIKLAYNTSSKTPTIHLPFHRERIQIRNNQWILATLNMMDLEMQKLGSLKKKKFNYTSSKTKVLYG